MSTQSCYPGDPYPYAPLPQYPQPQYVPCFPHYGTGITTWNAPITEERIREIFREELAFALQKMKEAP